MSRLQSLTQTHFFSILVIIFCCGIALSTVFYDVEKSIRIFVPLLLFAVLLALGIKCYRSLALLFISLFLLSGWNLGILSSQKPREEVHLVNLVETPADIVIIGRLKTLPAVKTTTTTTILESRYCKLTEEQSLQTCRGDVLLRSQFPWPGYVPGTMLAVRVTLKKPGKFNTPGSFNYPAYLARKDIWFTGFIRSPALIAPIHMETSFRETMRYLPERLRLYISNFLETNLSNMEQQTMYKALLIGERSSVPEYLYEQYKMSGLAHILAISGVHLSILGFLFYRFWYWLLRRSTYLILSIDVNKAAILISLFTLIFYTLLAGVGNPVARACMMAIIAGIAMCTNRIKSVPNLIALPAFIILAISPQNLFMVSFQLSFAAVIAIATCYPLLRSIFTLMDQKGSNRSKQIPFSFCKWVFMGFLTSCVAVLGTAPLVVYHFNRFPLLGPLANLLVEPLLCLWTLPLGFVAMLFVNLLPSFSLFLLHTGGLGISAANAITSWIASFPGHNLWMPSPSFLHITLYYSFFLSIPHVITKKRLAGYLMSSLFILLLLSLLLPVRLKAPSIPAETAVTFLDVGQGNATVIRLNDGRVILIDGGGSSWSSTTVGEKVLAPYFWKLGITKLYGVVVTHPDSDHYNGLPFIISHFNPEFLWTSTLETKEPGYKNLLEICEDKGVTVYQASANDTLRFGTTRLKCISNLYSCHGKGDENSGLVLQLKSPKISILFPGDIEEGSERDLLEEHLLIQSDILLAAHHGSNTSNSSLFLKAVNPAALIVSAGKSKLQHYPSTALKEYGKQRSMPIYSTHTSGTILLEQKNGAYQLSTYRSSDNNPLHRQSLSQIPVQYFDPDR